MTATDTTGADVIVAELFPCDVTDPDGTTHKTCRVVTYGDGTTRVWAWSKDDRSGVVVLEAVAAPVALNPGSKAWPRRYVVELPGDEAADVVHQHHCACGHPMKRWHAPGPRRAGR